jgi:hypothetical protein
MTNKTISIIRMKKKVKDRKEIDLKNVKVCKYCMKIVPKNLVCCWNCGKVLDKNLEKLIAK